MAAKANNRTAPTVRGQGQVTPREYARKARTRRKAVGYIRVSRENGRSENGDAYRTKELQRARIEELARQHGYRIVAWYEDEDESGKDTDRPGFQQALAHLDQPGGPEALIVAKLSRFARKVADTEATVARLERRSQVLIAGDLTVDTSTPWGKAIRQIMAIFAELELELARESWAEVQADALADGIYPRKAPPGYRKNDRKAPVRPGALEPDPEVAPLVVELFTSRAARHSWAEMARAWQAAGGPPVSTSGLRTIIENRVYLGETILGETVLEGTHEPLVTVEQWEAAQKVKAPRPWRSRDGSLLAGLMSCAECGGALTSTGQNGKRAPLYKCKANGHRMTISQHLADRVVEDYLLELGADIAAEGTPNGEEGLVAAQERLASLKAETERWVAETSGFDGDLLRSGLSRRQSAIEAAEEEVDRLKSERRVETVLVTLGGLWPDLDLEERRKLVAAGIESIVVSRPLDRSGSGTAPEAVRLAAARARLSITPRSDGT